MSKLTDEEVRDKWNGKNPAILKKKMKRKQKTYFHAHFDKDNLEEKQPLLPDRDYGLMKTTQTATPYPIKHKTLNMESLKARLEAQKEGRVSMSNLVSSDSSPQSLTDCYTFDEPILSFHMRRKIFDTAEYTICKGQKMSETFHHGSKVLNVPPEHDGSNDHSVRGSSHAFNFHSYKDLQDYCLTKNIKLAN